MSVKHASSFLLAMAMLMVSALGSACDVRCALGATGHHHDAMRSMHHAMHPRAAEDGMHQCPGVASAMQDGRGQSHVHGACVLDHVWAAEEQAPAQFDISCWHDFATATLRDARACDQIDAMWLRPPIHRASVTTRTTLPLRI